MRHPWLSRLASRILYGRPKESSSPLLIDVSVPLATARAAMARRAFDEALPILEELAETRGDLSEVLLDLGACRYALGDTAGAIAPLVGVIERDPDNFTAHRLLAPSLVAQGDLTAALGIAIKGIRLNSREPELLTLAATLYGQRAQYAQAIHHANLALEIQPESLGALLLLDQMAKLLARRRDEFEESPKVAEGRRRVINRLQAAHRKGTLGGEELTSLLTLLEPSGDTFAKAHELALASVAHQPMTPELAHRLASIFWTAGDAERTHQFSAVSFELDPGNLNYQVGLGLAGLVRGEEWADSWRRLVEGLYRQRAALRPQELPLWQGQSLGKRKILVYQDEGIGDAIVGLRLIEALVTRGVRFDLWLAPSFAEVVAGVPGFENLLQSAERPDGRNTEYAYGLPIFGAIPALGLKASEVRTSASALPISAGPHAFSVSVSALSGVRIGLVAGGNPERDDDWLRSIRPDALAPLAEIGNVSWVNLAFDARPEREEMVSRFGMLDLMGQVRGFADTAAIVKELDAVVAVDSSVAHLAAFLGKPVWVLLPTTLDWRWQMGKDTQPWWPTARVLRSEAPGVWKRALASLIEDVSSFAASPSRRVPSQSDPAQGPRL